jgi:3-oxoacyl-[acyl-carrier protein] reductase
MMDLQLNGKAALITGGSIGIGLAVAKALAKEGVNIIICSRNQELLDQESKNIMDSYDVMCTGIKCDVSKTEDINILFRQIKSKNIPIDILINNAGTGSNEKIIDAEDSKWQYYLDLHLMAAVRLSRMVIPLMKEKGEGIIINNASICAKQPLDYEPIYNVTKAALMMFTKCLANEVIKYNIRVNCINPGLVLTPDWVKTAKQLTKDQTITWENYLDDIAKKNAPIGRFATPEELANFFVFLCSPVSSYCVGSTYYVDGGWLNVIA